MLHLRVVHLAGLPLHLLDCEGFGHLRGHFTVSIGATVSSMYGQLPGVPTKLRPRRLPLFYDAMARDLSCPRSQDRPEARCLIRQGHGPGRGLRPNGYWSPGGKPQRLRARLRSTPDGGGPRAAGDNGLPRGTPRRETEVPEVLPDRNLDRFRRTVCRGQVTYQYQFRSFYSIIASFQVITASVPASSLRARDLSPPRDTFLRRTKAGGLARGR